MNSYGIGGSSDVYLIDMMEKLMAAASKVEYNDQGVTLTAYSNTTNVNTSEISKLRQCGLITSNESCNSKTYAVSYTITLQEKLYQLHSRYYSRNPDKFSQEDIDTYSVYILEMKENNCFDGNGIAQRIKGNSSFRKLLLADVFSIIDDHYLQQYLIIEGNNFQMMQNHSISYNSWGAISSPYLDDDVQAEAGNSFDNSLTLPNHGDMYPPKQPEERNIYDIATKNLIDGYLKSSQEAFYIPINSSDSDIFHQYQQDGKINMSKVGSDYRIALLEKFIAHAHSYFKKNPQDVTTEDVKYFTSYNQKKKLSHHVVLKELAGNHAESAAKLFLYGVITRKDGKLIEGPNFGLMQDTLNQSQVANRQPSTLVFMTRELELYPNLKNH